jgi:hypothetical protein
LLHILRNEEDAGVRASLIYAISGSVAGEDAVTEFLSSNGSALFREMFETKEPEIQRKCATFVEDKFPYNRNLAGVDDELKEWCRIFEQRLLQDPPEATCEKILSSLMYP